MDKVIVYIDGFNLYYGLKSKGWKRYYWLNIYNMAQNMLRPDQQIVEVKYFTARISTIDKYKKKRQDTYLDALDTIPKLRIFYGHYLLKTVHCNKCNNTWKAPEEKMTDVCIATELIMDAFNDMFDTAILVSVDSDLIPPISAVKHKYPLKRIGIAFPPDRISNDLKKHADFSFMIHRKTLHNSLLPEEISTSSGITLKRPVEWR